MNRLTKLLEIEKLTVKFKLSQRALFENVNWSIQRGEFWTLIGVNGCGKSTLLKMAAGIDRKGLTEAQGEILSQGAKVTEMDGFHRARQIAYLGGEGPIDFELTVEEFVGLGRLAHGAIRVLSEKDRTKIAAAIEKVEIQNLSGRDLRSLSGGERQLAGLARAFCTEAPLLILDESMSRLDLAHQWEILGHLEDFVRGGGAVILVAHDWNLGLRNCTHLAWMFTDAPHFVSGKFEDVFSAQNLRRSFPSTPLKTVGSEGERPLITFDARKIP
jgi:iron complex transport system ATP-binding protein